MSTQELLHELEKYLASAESCAQTAMTNAMQDTPNGTATFETWQHVRAAREYAAELRSQMEGAETVRKESEA